LGRKESAFAPDAQGGDAVRGAQRVERVLAEDRLSATGERALPRASEIAERHPGGGDLHGIFDLGGGRRAAPFQLVNWFATL